jgi:dienelactone hydrolase
MKKLVAMQIIVMLAAVTAKAQFKVTLPSIDGVTITADWYPMNTDKAMILMCHQNRFSRGEYEETALRLNKLGFNCFAIDQRVGEEVNGIKNETAEDAKKKGKTPTYIDAEQDIVAAVEYLYGKYNKKVIIIGSSYSASLALKIAAENDHVLAVAAFSPGEYFGEIGFVAKHIKGLMKPVFLTSSKAESASVTDLAKDVNSRIKVQYIPKGAGDHGSKVLWSDKPEYHEYWLALISFLNKIKDKEQ